jgi:hypothetical protein
LGKSASSPNCGVGGTGLNPYFGKAIRGTVDPIVSALSKIESVVNIGVGEIEVIVQSDTSLGYYQIWVTPEVTL